MRPLMKKLFDGTATAAEREALLRRLEEGALDEAEWKAESGPDVFDAAFDEVHPRRRWWRLWVPIVALSAAALVAPFAVPHSTNDGVKGGDAVPSIGLMLVVLDAPTHRLERDERVPLGAQLGVRTTTSARAWLALEELREGEWRRLWPVDPRGAPFEAGEHEVADRAGALVLRVEERPRWTLRFVGAETPLDVAATKGHSEPVNVEVEP